MHFKKRDDFATAGFWASVGWGCVVEVTGEDAAEFLQGQFSQELKEGRAERVPYGFWLTRTGKVQGDSWVVRAGAGRYVLLSRGLKAAALMARLEHHIIADDVYLTDQTAQWHAAWYAGGEAMRCMAEAEAALEVGGEGWVVRERVGMPGGSGYCLTRSEPRPPEGLTELTEAELERIRILAGVPRVPVDLGENDLPQEGGFERAGVNFTKGCYLGQEVMARIQATGRVRRRLVQVAGEGTMPTGEGEALFLDGRQVGTLRSRAANDDGGWQGIAMVGAAVPDVDGGELAWGAADGIGLRWRALPPPDELMR